MHSVSVTSVAPPRLVLVPNHPVGVKPNVPSCCGHRCPCQVFFNPWIFGYWKLWRKTPGINCLMKTCRCSWNLMERHDLSVYDAAASLFASLDSLSNAWGISGWSVLWIIHTPIYTCMSSVSSCSCRISVLQLVFLDGLVPYTCRKDICHLESTVVQYTCLSHLSHPNWISQSFSPDVWAPSLRAMATYPTGTRWFQQFHSSRDFLARGMCQFWLWRIW